jgi:hypothetical protein
LSKIRGCPSFKASKGEAEVVYREPLATQKMGVTSAFPACWVVAESEAQRVNKNEKALLKPQRINIRHIQF